MAEQSDDSKQSRSESENDVWSALQKRQQRKRDFLWLLFAFLLLLLLGNLTGFPGRFFT